MKRIYYAHPLRGDVPENTRKIGEIIRQAVTDDPSIIPLSPIHNFSFVDPEKYDPARGMQMCFGLLEIADELHLYGDWRNSEGCIAERAFAWCRKIPIRIMGGTE